MKDTKREPKVSTLCLIATAALLVSQIKSQEFSNVESDQTPSPTPAPRVEQEPQAAQAWTLTTQGIDTSADEGRGNWFKKKQILQQARTLYKAIQENVKKVLTETQETHNRFTQTAQQFIQKAAELPVNQELVKKTSDTLQENIDKLATAPQKTDQNREQLVSLHDSKKMLEEFANEFVTLQDILGGLAKSNQTIAQLPTQLHTYEQSAWSLYENIDATLSDQIASQFFNHMQLVAENVQLIEKYLYQDAPVYYGKAMQQGERTMNSMVSLYKVLVERSVFEPAKEHPVPAATPAAEQKPVIQESWWRWLINAGIRLWHWFVGLFSRTSSR